MTLETEIAALRAEVAALRDRQEIFALIQRECRARDRQDVEQIAGCWWEDGVDEHGAVVSKAPDYPARANRGHAMNFNMTSHNITNQILEITGETAHCESYVVGALAWKEGQNTTLAFGRYLDRVVRRGGQWRILVRRCTIEATADCDGSWVHSANVKGFLKGLWSKDDPSYERPCEWKPRDQGVRW